MFRAIQLIMLSLMLGITPVALAAQGTFTTIDFPGATDTFGEGINARGDPALTPLPAPPRAPRQPRRSSLQHSGARRRAVWTGAAAWGRVGPLGRPGATAAGRTAEGAASGKAVPADAATSPASCPTTSADENKVLARRWWDEVWSGGNVDALDELLADDHLHHWAGGPDTTGVDPIKERVEMWRATFPDLSVTSDTIIAEGDLVAARWTATGTDQGGFRGAPPTGQAVEWSGINVFRFECGRIVEIWSEMDTLGLFDQLGAMDAMIATPEP